MSAMGLIAIIGAGPTGLGAAYRLQELGHHDYVVLEAGDSAGGLASSFIDTEGFTWDVGGHVQFSHYSYYDRVLDALPIAWLQHQREAWVWIKGRFVPYPFQNNIHRLDEEDCARALRGMQQAALGRPGRATPADFHEWILSTFGRDIGDLFLLPYNYKVWAYPPRMLGTSWIGDRVAVPDLDRIARNIADCRDDVSWGPNTVFRFPSHGGTGAIWRQLSAQIRNIEYRSAVASIDIRARRLHLAGGRSIAYDTLISSMPIPEFCRRAPGLSGEAHRAAESLTYSSTHVIGIGLRGRTPAPLAKKCWMYFPEEHSPYYRVTVFSNYAPSHVPPGDAYWSLMAEVSESPRRPVNRERLVDQVIDALEKDCLVASDVEVVSRWHRTERYGYPTPTPQRDGALATVQAELERCGVLSRGRFGAWKYEVSNQDHSFMQGVEAANRLAGIGEEHTISRADYVNNGAFREAADSP